MRNEYGLLRSQLMGYLFEIVVLELLRKNGFSEINVAAEPPERVRETREGFVELKGRGCWHQIDCPCEYNRMIPFSFPLRLLGEVKFYRSPLDKKRIREFVGVIKDIQENYFVADGMRPEDIYPRKMETGVYFSANGFQAEAEKLAYAHGIKTISYANNYLLDRIKLLIEELERNYLSVRCLKENWNDFRRDFIWCLNNGHQPNAFRGHNYWADGYQFVLNELSESITEIQTSFIATTATGVFIHFISDATFPIELFLDRDDGWCRVYYGHDNFQHRYFWLVITGDPFERRFYFTPPMSLDRASLYGQNTVLGEKERLFRTLNVNITINGVSRNLTLQIDEDWLDAMRRNTRG